MPGPERPPAEREARARAAPGRAGSQGPSGPPQSGSQSGTSPERQAVEDTAGRFGAIECVEVDAGRAGIDQFEAQLDRGLDGYFEPGVFVG